MNVFKDLDPILHSQLRMAIISLLMREKEAEFTELKERTRATAGNLSVQINKLKDAGYIDVFKDFKDNYPHTICKITTSGSRAFDLYVKSLQSYLTVSGKKS
jgi:DNA-binding MarR family transcriptional regulator